MRVVPGGAAVGVEVLAGEGRLVPGGVELRRDRHAGVEETRLVRDDAVVMNVLAGHEARAVSAAQGIRAVEVREAEASLALALGPAATGCCRSCRTAARR